MLSKKIFLSNANNSFIISKDRFISNCMYVLNVMIYSNIFEIELIIKARGMNLFANIFCFHVSQTTNPRKFWPLSLFIGNTLLLHTKVSLV